MILILGIFLLAGALGSGAAMFWNLQIFTILLSSLSLVLFILIGCGFIAHLGLAYLQIYEVAHPAWRQTNAIIILGNGTIMRDTKVRGVTAFGETRVLEGARLYHDCMNAENRVCRILVTGGDPAKRGFSEASTMKQDLADLGVQPLDIVLEEQSHNTIENAKFSKERLPRDSVELAVLVTSGYHLRRAIAYFTHEYGEILPAPADTYDAPVSWLPSATNFFLTQIVTHEFLGLLQNSFYLIMGWRYENPKPGAL